MSVTEEDRDKARQIVGGGRNASMWLVAPIAQALADEREKALAPVLALADRWEAQLEGCVENPWDRVTIRSHVDHLRRVVEAVQ